MCRFMKRKSLSIDDINLDDLTYDFKEKKDFWNIIKIKGRGT